jgi:exopolysaccharide biosynthesis polyprenyl glycosylphosphotransferase
MTHLTREPADEDRLDPLDASDIPTKGTLDASSKAVMTQLVLSSQGWQKVNRFVDVAIVLGASFVATSHRSEPNWAQTILIATVAVGAWLLVSRGLRHYMVDNGRSLLGDFGLTFVLIGATTAPLILIRHTIQTAGAIDSSRFLMSMAAVLLVRWVITGRRLWRERPLEEILIVGAGPLGRLTHGEIRESGRRGHVIGYLRFDDDPVDARLKAPILGTTTELETLLRSSVVDEVYFASTAATHHFAIQSMVEVCERLGTPFAIPACGYRLARAQFSSLSSIPDGYVHLSIVRLRRIEAILKRFLDIAVSFAALIVLSPALAALPFFITLTSRGPVLFRQKRVGLHGRTFNMLKFRSMVADAELRKDELLNQNEQSGPVFKIQKDPRVTPLGRFMRKYSLDELPQLINVLRGDMSIVGPRPPLPSEVAKYESWQCRRLSVRPGLTCVWQVSGRNEIGFQEWMLLDMRYIDHWSVARDAALVLKTLPVVLLGRGAS